VKALRAVCLTPAAALLVLFALCATTRLPFPFELGWMEGATLMHVRRLLEGAHLYTQPSIHFVPFAYPPLYYYVCLPFAWMLGPWFMALRAVSVLATVMTMVLVWNLVRRENGHFAGVVAAARA
jgi:4-amino-4-deoxy-L-arabinose transferase-like glycosyltransferase